MAIRTTPTKSVRLAVTGIQVVLKENLSICRISCQIGGPGRRWIRAISFRWIPSRSRPKSVARTSSVIISVPDERDVTSRLSCHPPEKKCKTSDGECRYKHSCTDRERDQSREVQARCYHADTCTRPEDPCYCRFLHPHHPSITTSTTRRKIRSEESEHMITYGAPGARNISAFAA